MSLPNDLLLSLLREDAEDRATYRPHLGNCVTSGTFDTAGMVESGESFVAFAGGINQDELCKSLLLSCKSNARCELRPL
jgi:hypothetical protein